jgi:hypothetical protein
VGVASGSVEVLLGRGGPWRGAAVLARDPARSDQAGGGLYLPQTVEQRNSPAVGP